MAKTHWAKLSGSLHSNPKVRRAGRNGREVFVFVLCKNAESGATGSVSIDHADPDYLADQLMMPLEDAVDGLRRAVAAKLLVVDDRVRIVGWDDEYARGPMSNAERQEAFRAREKAKKEPASVTGNDSVTEPVTSNEMPVTVREATNSNEVTESSLRVTGVVTSNGSERSEREIREREARVTEFRPATGKAELGGKWAIAERLWILQETLRREVDEAAVEMFREDTIRLVTPLLDAGRTEAQLEHVLRVYAAEATGRADEKLKFFNGRTNWKPEQVDRALNRKPPIKQQAKPKSRRPMLSPLGDRIIATDLDTDEVTSFPASELAEREKAWAEQEAS